MGALRVSDDPESLTQFVHRCRQRGVTPGQLLDCVELADRDRQGKTGPDRQVADRVVYGLLLALGEFDLAELPAGTPTRGASKEQSAPTPRGDASKDSPIQGSSAPFLRQLADWYVNDPSSAVHGAAGWLLRRWKQSEVVERVDRTPLAYSPDREWYVMKFVEPDQPPG
ncbi:MAG TPA: hypothetical protein VGX78_03610, partial [Pirellulales bacterium]|nr:hypothetical protein [Pirellulales bacterium]